MTSEFVNKKGKPSAQEYLDASIEEIIERTNKSPQESEIPFVTALLAARANRDQKSTSNRMFYMAIITTLITSFTLLFSWFNSNNKTKNEIEVELLKTEMSNIRKELAETKRNLQDSNQQFLSLKSKVVLSDNIVDENALETNKKK